MAGQNPEAELLKLIQGLPEGGCLLVEKPVGTGRTPDLLLRTPEGVFEIEIKMRPFRGVVTIGPLTAAANITDDDEPSEPPTSQNRSLDVWITRMAAAIAEIFNSGTAFRTSP